MSSVFEQSSLWSEVKDVVHTPKDYPLYDYKGTIHTEKEDYQVWDMSSIETIKDYVHDVAESGKVIFRIGLGDYVSRLYPYRNNLEFTIKRIPTNGKGDDDFTSINVTRYKAIFNPTNNPPVGGTELETNNAEDLNIMSIVEVHLELIDRCAEPLRIKTTGGAFRRVKQEDLIRSILGGESSKILVDGKPIADGIDLVPPDNKETLGTVVIPHGVSVTAVPTYLQQEMGGVYNCGIGTYFQNYGGKKLWFIYPLYNSERFDSKDKRMIFYAVPQERLPQVDRSYKIDGDISKVVVTAQKRYSDSAEISLINEGSGYRVADARAFMKKPVEMTEKGPVARRVNLNHEVASKERTDGLNYAPVSKTGPSANPYVQRSAILSRTMAQIDLVWENADPTLIYPGMPCKYIYLSHGKPVSLRGTIVFVHSFTARVEKYNASAFRMTCRVSIACEPQSKTPDIDPIGDTAYKH